jgi:hypothetical protein
VPKALDFETFLGKNREFGMISCGKGLNAIANFVGVSFGP